MFFYTVKKIISPTDIDECVTKNVACLNGGTCVDKINNFECRCASGFRGQFCGERGKAGSYFILPTLLPVTIFETVSN